MNLNLRRASAGIASISLFVMMGQGCPGGGGGGLPGSSTISLLEVTDAVAGGAGRIRVTLVDPVSSNTQVTLTAGSAGIANVPATLTIPSGSASGTASYTAIASGVTTITASLGASQRTETASVVGSLQITELFASGADLDSGGTAVQTGSSGTIGVFLNATVASDTIVNLSSDNPAVVAVPATLTIPEFENGRSISFLAATAGVATITAELNGQIVTTKIQVSDTISIVTVAVYSSLSAGEQGQLYIKLDATTAADTTVSLTSSNPAVITIPATGVVSARNSYVYVPIQALAVGKSTLTATLGPSSRTATVTVAGAAVLTDFTVQADYQRTEARFLSGKTIDLNFLLSSDAVVDTVIQLSSSNPSIVNLPASITIPAGFDFMSFSFPTSGAGATTLTATLGSVSLQVKLTFVNSPSITQLSVDDQLLAGTPTTLEIDTDVALEVDTAVSLASSNTSVLNVPATLVIPAGQTSASTPLTAGVTGTTLVTATLGASQKFSVVSVVSQVAIDSLYAGSGLEVGGVGSVNASLNVDVPADTVVTVSTSPAGLLLAPASFVVSEGSSYGQFVIQALAPGNAIITCTLNGVAKQTSVKVVNNASVTSISGSVPLNGLGSIYISLDANVSADTVVTLTNTNPAAFTTPPSVIIFAGDSNTSFEAFGLTATPTTITATLGASSANTIITPSP